VLLKYTPLWYNIKIGCYIIGEVETTQYIIGGMSMSKKLNNISITGLVFIVLLVGTLSGCITTNNRASIKETNGSNQKVFWNITPEEAKKRLDSEKDIILLDVRTKEEFESGYIPGAVLIPLDRLEEEAASILKDKEATILVYCRSGNRSVTASNILIRQGYTKIYNLGGIIDWPYEIVK
jgi:phage shock protein E